MKSTFRKIKIFFAVVILSLSINTLAVAQCKSVVKEGIKKLTPYTHNGQINSATMKEGKSVEIHLSFYKGLYYKLQICSEKSVGKISFRVLDENKKEVYNSDTEDKADFWNFFSNSAQDLVVELKSSSDKSKGGCVAVLVGMQVPRSNNPIRNL